MNVYIVLKFDQDFLCMTSRPGKKMKEIISIIIKTHTHTHSYIYVFVSKANIIMLKEKQIGKLFATFMTDKIIFQINLKKLL